MRTSYVFNNNTTNNANRSFISTAMMSDSLAYGDDLRKYSILLFQIKDPEFAQLS